MKSCGIIVMLLSSALWMRAPGAVAAAAPEPPDHRAQGSDPAEVVGLGQRLRCPVCQGMPIGESPAPMAQDMMKQVRRLWAEGRSDKEIEAYFTARYGSWVLLEPPHSGVGMWVWLLPPLVGGAALIYALTHALGRRRQRPPVAQGLGIVAGTASERPDAPSEALAAIRRQI